MPDVIGAVWGFITLCDSDCMFKLNGHFHPQEDTLHWVYTAQRQGENYRTITHNTSLYESNVIWEKITITFVLRQF